MIINEIVEELKSKNMLFFVGSAISISQPSNLPSVDNIKKEVIRSLCGNEFKNYFKMLYNNNDIKNIIKSIQHEEFIEEIYKSLVKKENLFKIFECLKHSIPNFNHIFLAKCLGSYYDTIITTNQDTLIEKALYELGNKLVRINRYGDKLFTNGRIIKIHGDVDYPNTIITLLTQLARGLPFSRRKLLKSLIENMPVCFVGYSGTDQDIFRILMYTRPKKIYWDVKSMNDLTENLKKIKKRYPERVCIFECDLNKFFNLLANRLDLEVIVDYRSNYYDYSSLFDKWASELGIERFAILGRILGSVRIAKYREATRCFKKIFMSYDIKDKYISANSYYLYGNVLMNNKESPNNYKEAINYYTLAKKIYEKEKDVKNLIKTQIAIGDAYRHQSKYDYSEKMYKNILTKISNKCYTYGRICRSLADLYRMEDRYEEAIDNYQKAYRIFNRLGYILDSNTCHIWLSDTYMYKGELYKANFYNTLALKVASKYYFNQNLVWAKFVRIEIDKCKIDHKNISKLIPKLNELIEEFKYIKNRLGLAWCYLLLGEIYRLLGNYKTSQYKLDNASSFCGKNIDYKVCYMYILLNKAELLKCYEKYKESLDIYQKVVNTKIGKLQRHKAHAYLGIAEIKKLIGKDPLDEYSKALEIYGKINMKQGLVNTYIRLGLFLRSEKILEKARTVAIENKLTRELELINKINKEDNYLLDNYLKIVFI